jgi:hypothetical protein
MSGRNTPQSNDVLGVNSPPYFLRSVANLPAGRVPVVYFREHNQEVAHSENCNTGNWLRHGVNVIAAVSVPLPLQRCR